MFTGIVQTIAPVVSLQSHPGVLRYAIEPPPLFLKELTPGASIAVDGVCQTVIDRDEKWVWFEAIEATLRCTTLKNLALGGRLNCERAARIGDEIGGHLLSGHVYGVAAIERIEGGSYLLSCPQSWMKYFFLRGFIALDGISLTLGSIDQEKGHFTVNLIPETLKRTTLGYKKVGDLVNVEIDPQTQIIVETLLSQNLTLYKTLN